MPSPTLRIIYMRPGGVCKIDRQEKDITTYNLARMNMLLRVAGISAKSEKYAV